MRRSPVWAADAMSGADRKGILRFLEIASVFERQDHVASLIVNANHRTMRAAEKLRVADCRLDAIS